MEKNQLLNQVIAAYLLNKRRRRRQRSLYVRPIFIRRKFFSESILIQELRTDPNYHHKYFRMNVESFDLIYHKVKPYLEHDHTHALPISAVDRLAITIRYLATGNSQTSLAINFRISPSAVSQILRETMHAIWETMGREFMPNPTKDDWSESAKAFAQKWQFPNCCGSIDGKHVRIKCPAKSGSAFYNYKNYFSIVLFAIADANYVFRIVDIGRCGSESDGGILQRSQINHILQDNSMSLPEDSELPNGVHLPHVILGDDAFPLRLHLMRPYAGKFLDRPDRTFNYRLSRARLVVENAFGILAARWRIFHTCIEAKLDLAKLIVKSATVLHNFLMIKNDMCSLTVDTARGDDMDMGNWREVIRGDNNLQPIPRQGSHNCTNNAASIREEFKKYFLSNEGRLPWQEKHINSGFI